MWELKLTWGLMTPMEQALGQVYRCPISTSRIFRFDYRVRVLLRITRSSALGTISGH